jgi:hypothetical protein
MEALEHIPKIEAPLLTEKGEATLQKTDIFRKIMWFGFVAENTWYPLNVERVNQILQLNREGKKPANLDIDVLAEKIPVETLNSDLARMDQKFKGKSKKKKKKRGGGDKGSDSRGGASDNRGGDNRGGAGDNRGGDRGNRGNDNRGNRNPKPGGQR